jgi:nicotinamidase-related amidase
MESLEVRRSLVLAIDFQGKLMGMVHRPQLLKSAAVRVLKIAALFGVPALLTEQYPKGIGPTHPEVRAAFDAHPGPKRLLEKTAFGCGGDPAFEPALRDLLPGVLPEDRQVVVMGIEAHVCVMQTVLHILRQGSQVHVLWDAVSGRGDEYRRHALERMAQAGAVLTNHESAAFEWAGTKDHPQFKALSALLKEGQLQA